MHMDYPEKTLSDLLKERAAQNPEGVQFIFYDREITFGETQSVVTKLASSLQKEGIKKGSRVALILPNCPQFAFAYYAVQAVGGVVVPVNPLYTEHELKHILEDSGAELAFVMDMFYSTLKKAMPVGNLRKVVSTNIADYMPGAKAFLGRLLRKVPSSNEPDRDGIVKFKDFVRNGTEPEPVTVDVHNDPAVLMYTGGTTGTPKAAILTPLNLVSNCMMNQKWGYLTEQDTMVGVLPWFHVYGMSVVLNSTLTAGLKVIVLPRFLTKDTFEAVKKHRPTSFPGVFSMYIALMGSPLFPSYKQYFSGIKRCISGAAPLPAEVAKNWNSSTGALVVEGYGLSEASPVTHANPMDDQAKVKPGSIGIPFPDTDAKIVDLETGEKQLGVKEVGELAVSGPQVAKGYWNNEQDTKTTFRNGWLYTGDIAYMDEDGYFYIVDRKKDMINVGGLKVYPREVEEVAYTHEAVKMAAVVGVPDQFHGEEPKMFVVLKDGYKGKVTPDQIREFMKGKLAPYKIPRIIEFRDELPTTLVGKVLRRKLKES
ncbi:MAG: long-chain fatty acid--CoA ligase [Nitrososphaerota archaeon]|nr:long-chain fatty acid--CoA ligase [Nitrososphaerota archaeon]